MQSEIDEAALGSSTRGPIARLSPCRPRSPCRQSVLKELTRFCVSNDRATATQRLGRMREIREEFKVFSWAAESTEPRRPGDTSPALSRGVGGAGRKHRPQTRSLRVRGISSVDSGRGSRAARVSVEKAPNRVSSPTPRLGRRFGTDAASTICLCVGISTQTGVDE